MVVRRGLVAGNFTWSKSRSDPWVIIILTLVHLGDCKDAVYSNGAREELVRMPSLIRLSFIALGPFTPSTFHITSENATRDSIRSGCDTPCRDPGTVREAVSRLL